MIFKQLMLHAGWHIVAILLAPLGAAGFLVTAAIISRARGEELYPPDALPFAISSIAFSNIVISICLFIPVLYTVVLLAIPSNREFMGLRKRVLEILAIATYSTGIAVALILLLLVIITSK